MQHEAKGSITIDFDTLECYTGIHALRTGALPRALRGEDPLVTTAVERFGELMSRHALLGTSFVIGSSLDRPAAAKAFASLHAAGHELANHSQSHDYRLSLRPRKTIDAELEAGAAALFKLTGIRPLGFRAPGYNLSATLLECVARTGHRYDSSAFPCFPYYAARASVLGVMALLGRPSASHAGPGLGLLAPTHPYRPHPRDFWRRGRGPLQEFPISVLPLLGLPLIGTAISVLPRPLLQAAIPAFARLSWVNLELHGIDLLDDSDGLPPELADRQRDLKVPVREKMRRLDRLLKALAEGHTIKPLAHWLPAS